jgi:nicotinamidase-related amidase
VCVDSTARSAHERGYRVTILSDCTMGRTRCEHRLFCEGIFPLYAEVRTSDEVADWLRVASPALP